MQMRKFMSGLLVLSTSFAMTGLGLVSTAYGAQITFASASLSNPRPASASVSHTIDFKIASTGNIEHIELQYANAASGSTAIPDGLGLSGASIGSISFGGETSGWTLDTSAAAGGALKITRSSATSFSSGAQFTVRLDGITNNTLNSGCDAITGSESCFLRITTHQTSASTVQDQTTITYTVTDAVTVTATVDPILTFTVNGVTSTSVSSNDTNVGSGTSVTTTSTTLPFGNVTVGTPKMAQQQLYIQTNANNGYYAYGKFVTTGGGGTDVMTGNANASNNIDKFTLNSAAWSGVGAGPQTWGTPTGTAQNVDSAWLGVRTNDVDIANFGANKYSPPDVSTDSGSGRSVMQSSGPDNGSTPAYVTFKIQANAFQPADSYSGTWVYNVLASY